MSNTDVFLRAHWRYLAMINYRVDPAILQPLVPAGTELDDFRGVNYASMVGFLFLDTRLMGLPIPLHRNFAEVNLRFYVRRRLGDEVRRGVVFVKEIVPRPAIAAVANLAYNENYVTLPMRHEIRRRATQPDVPAVASFGWRYQGRWHELWVATAGEAELPRDGSEAAFITEHYWGYARQRDGGTVEYRVEHPQWAVWNGVECDLDCDIAALYGETFVPYLSAPPTSAFIAAGSDVAVHRGKRLALEPA